MFLEEGFEHLAVFLWAVVLSSDDSHIRIFKIYLMKNISGQVIQMWDVRGETVGKLRACSDARFSREKRFSEKRSECSEV